MMDINKVEKMQRSKSKMKYYVQWLKMSFFLEGDLSLRRTSRWPPIPKESLGLQWLAQCWCQLHAAVILNIRSARSFVSFLREAVGYLTLPPFLDELFDVSQLNDHCTTQVKVHQMSYLEIHWNTVNNTLFTLAWDHVVMFNILVLPSPLPLFVSQLLASIIMLPMQTMMLLPSVSV